ncbi:NB-ARC domain-containing protein [Gloeothece verrucosa]|uniref:NB-ARC domain-containing protein n=1 Tax=Gloeothece verrucosa TaxID=2546359 RepID=UPI000900635C
MKQKLLDDNTAQTGTLVISAIYGLGGIGKSTLAAALCYEPAVQSHFPDGILWATLGQEPDLLSLVCSWIERLGDYSYKPTTVEVASIHLRTLLYEQSVLLVVDDVWNPEDVEPFRVGGAGCRVLVTTREAKILGAERYDLDVMTPEQAEALLTHAWRAKLTEKQKKQAQTLAKTVGYLPLALELAAAQAADGVSLRELIEDLQGETARLETLDLYGAEDIPQEEKRKKYSLLASFNLSLGRLSKDYLDKFAWLGIVPEDVSITSQMAATLWNCQPRKARESLRYLRAKALLLSGVSTEEESSYRLHDLVHDLARKKLTELGLSLEAAHQQFLNYYRAKTEGGLWHTLPDDGYIHAHLTWHLQKAGLSAEIHQLLQEETEEGANGWYWACDSLGKTSIFMQDAAQAWELADEKEWEGVGLQVRYALITSSLNSLAGNIPPELMAALIEQKKWTPAQGLAYTLQIQDQKKLAEAIAAIAPYLPSSLLSEAVSVARSIEDEKYRAFTLRKLVAHLAKVSIEEAVSLARSIKDKIDRAIALRELVAHLAKVSIEKAVSVARSIEHEFDRAIALRKLVAHRPELIEEAVSLTRSIENKFYRAIALSELVAHRPELIEEAISVARSIEDEFDRAIALRKLVAHRPELIEEAISVARSIEDEFDRAIALRGLVAHRPELIEEAISVARSIKDDIYRVFALRGLVAHRPKLIEEAISVARSIESEYFRARALSELVAHRPELIEETVSLTRSIKDKSYRARALSELVAHLAKVSIEEAVSLACSIESEYFRARALSELVAHRPELIEEAISLARFMEDEYDRASVLRELVAHLAKVSIEEAVSLACSIESEYFRARALSELVAHLAEVSIKETVCLARSIESEYFRVFALSELVAHRPELIEEVVSVARSIEDEFDRDDALSKLVAHLAEVSIKEAVSLARSIESGYLRASALRELVAHLAEVSIEEAVSVAHSIEFGYLQASALSELVAHRPELIEEAVSLARSIEDEFDRASVLRELVAHLAKVSIEKAVCFARSIKDKSDRARALSELIAHQPELIEEALSVARSIKDKLKRAATFSKMLPQIISTGINFALWKEILHLLACRERRDFLQDIKNLTPVILQFSGKEAIKEVFRAIQDVGRWWN